MVRSFFAALGFLLWMMPTMASGASLKGVKGLRKLQTEAPLPKEPPIPKEDEMVKKCKKYKETPMPKATPDPLATPPPKATAADGAVDPKDPKAPPPPGDKAAADKAAKDKLAKDKLAADKESAALKADPKALEEAECLEWYESEGYDSAEAGDREGEGGSEEISEPQMGNTEFQSVQVDCEDIANGDGPTDSHSVSFEVNIDVLKDADSSLQDVYSQMERELQMKVAPRIAGCSSNRKLADSGSSKIVNVEFGDFDLNRAGCGSSLSKEASERDGVCTSSDIPVDVYFVGDFPESAIAKVEVAIEEHEWGVDGLLDTSEVAVAQTASTLPSSSGETSPAVYAGVAVAVLVVALLGFCVYRKCTSDEPVVAKAELDTDEESDDEKYKKVQHVEARRVSS